MLNDKAVQLEYPDTTLDIIGREVPWSLRGEVYRTTFVAMRSQFNLQPEYIFDEWTAYTNGADARRQLGIRDRQETLRYAIEFCVYATCVAKTDRYFRPQTRLFIVWQIERVLKLFKGSGVQSSYLESLRNEDDAEELRAYMRRYFGEAWTLTNLGF